jgi:quercetin dioxygenase-like cupin family protein
MIHAVLTRDTPTQAKILVLEATMREMDGQIEIPVRHYFANGLYAREMTMPAGAVAVGKIHKTQHINVLSKGKVTIATEDGPRTVEAPYTWVVEAGKKAAAVAHEETVWTSFCVNPTNETDLDKLEATLISPSYLDELEGGVVCPSLP